MVDVEEIQDVRTVAEDEPCELTSRRRAEGERALLHALLVDAMRCLFGEVGGSPAKRERLAAEARAWITTRGDADPFSFENVCAWLDLPAGRLRAYVLAQAAQCAVSPAVNGRHGASRHPFAHQGRLRRERNASIRALRAAGEPARNIAERFGLSYDSILLICKDPCARARADERDDDGEMSAAAAG
jgi:hypothetical protein